MPAPFPPSAVAWRFLAIGAVRYARSTLASAVKILLGRKPHFTAHDVLFRQYLGRLLGFGTLSEITSVHSSREGAGSQALMAMNAIRFAREQGLTYVHTPFSDIHHADRPAGQWASAWEGHFNLGLGEKPARSTPVNFALTCSELWELFGVGTPGPFSEELRSDFRRKYYADKTPRKNATLSVCIHVRSKNQNDFPDVEVADKAQLAAVVSRLLALLTESGMAYTVRLFSQGDARDFDMLRLPSDALFLDADPYWTMGELIEADLLVTTKGTFGWVSALLCDGIVLADPLQFALQPDWVPYDADGKFDTSAVRHSVKQARP